MLESLRSLPDDPDDLKGLVALMGEEIKSLTLKVEDLQGQLAAHRKARFGSKSESLDQLAFDLQEDSEIARAAQAQHDETGPDDDATQSETHAKRQHSRAPLPDHLERQTEVLSPGDACASCGGALRPLGEDVTQELEYIPGRFVVRQIVRPRMACNCCETFAQAPLPSRPIERGRAGPGLLAHVLVGKYCDHLPWWDRLLGTYVAQPAKGHHGMEIGIEQFRTRRDLWLDRMLVQPVRGPASGHAFDSSITTKEPTK
jgi:hypothetical protein